MQMMNVENVYNCDGCLKIEFSEQRKGLLKKKWKNKLNLLNHLKFSNVIQI